jgi:hypothetical protein
MNRWTLGTGLGITLALTPAALAQNPAQTPARPEQTLVARYCADCHSGAEKAAGLDLDAVSRDDVTRHAETWERVVRKLRARQMPPADATRPDEPTYKAVLSSLETALDQAAAARPNPGRSPSFRRLSRTEYQNAIRDLLALEVDVQSLLPPDTPSHGFDNGAAGNLSPALLERYLSAAQEMSRLAVGSTGAAPGGDTIRLPADLTQEQHVPGLPLGTRGGALVPYNFPQTGEYEIQVRLTRDRNEEVEGLKRPHEVVVLLDRRQEASFTVSQSRAGSGHDSVDTHLKARIHVAAGPHKLGVTFVQQSDPLLETRRQPYQAHYNMHRHPRQTPAIYQISIVGPYAASGPGDTPSRRRIFGSELAGMDNEEASAKGILSALIRRAYRRPVSDEDLARPMELYRESQNDGGFDAGIELALSSILVSPHFLFRIETDPPGADGGTAYRVSDVQLASRLSFFLWSSIPDNELLDLAEAGKLGESDVLLAQVRRMLADDRATSLATNFAAQWLHLARLEAATPDMRLFPDFDDNLRQAFRRETELLFESVLREDRSVLDLLQADYTFLNERLAKHYGIEHIYGSRFRRVALDPGSERGGLLRQGSILTVTSYATRTSPVIRGKWVLENLLGTPPPPPPANVPTLADNTVSATLSVRERLAAHRANAACAGCHQLIDPPGFSLENFDAVGRWRTVEEARPIDASGGLPDGSAFEGAAGLEQALLSRKDVFASTLAEKLLTFAIGRGIEPADGPAIRKIVKDAAARDYRFRSLIEGIVTSTPFQMRTAQ